jgi:hypothetical protein
MKARDAGGAPWALSWTSPAEIAAVLQRLWSNGRLLAARLEGEPLFPMTLSLRRPPVSALAERFDAVDRWIRTIEQQDRRHRGFGYDVVWVEVENRQIGRILLPNCVVVPSETDALRLIAKDIAAAPFDAMVRKTLAILPALHRWLTKNPLRALRYAHLWDRLITLVAWFVIHPQPRVYVRQIDLRGIGATFVEEHRSLIAELLDEVLAPDVIDSRASKVRQFEQRYGLLAVQSRVRFRVLDKRLSISGLTDVSIPSAEFAKLSLPADRVFITENEENGLAFPEVPGSVIVLVRPGDDDRLAEAAWLRDRPLFYWGNIDSCGFETLDRLRAVLPHAQSFLMDRETLLAHQGSWATGSPAEPGTPPTRLTEDELALLDDLRGDKFGAGVNLAQDRISYRWLLSGLERTLTASARDRAVGTTS